MVYLRNYYYQPMARQIDIALTTDVAVDKYLRTTSTHTRVCNRCKSDTVNAAAICIHCHGNYHTNWLFYAQMIPLLGVPFSVARSYLTYSRATREARDVSAAYFDVVFTTIDIALLPVMAIGAAAAVAGRGTASALTSTRISAASAGPMITSAVNDSLTVGTMAARGTLTAMRSGAETVEADGAPSAECTSLLRLKGHGEPLLALFVCRCPCCEAWARAVSAEAGAAAAKSEASGADHQSAGGADADGTPRKPGDTGTGPSAGVLGAVSEA